MMRVIALSPIVVAICAATSSSAQDLVANLPSGQIVPFGDDAYQVREPPPLDVADKAARQKAAEYCKRIGKSMVIKSGTFSLGAGLFLTFTCVPLRQDPADR